MAMKIREEAFCTNGAGYDCELVLKRDKALILREAETSHKEELEDMYDKHTLRPKKVRVFLDDNDIPIYGMIIYIIDYRDGRTSRYAYGEYYPISNKTLMPHPFQGSIC